MTYTARAGESLWQIAKNQLGDPNRWSEIAKLNHIHQPFLIFVGQRLQLPGGPASVNGFQSPTISLPVTSSPQQGQNGALIAARGLFFVVVKQVEPSGKLVRKVISLPETDINALVVNHPDLFGFHPRSPGSAVSPGEHALGETLSRYISVSNKPGGAPNFEGTAWYIDIAKTQRSGAKIITTEQIVTDLDRLAAGNPSIRGRVAKLKSVIGSVEGEVLIDGSVPKGAVQTAEQAARELSLLRGMATGARVLGAVGVVMTAYDLGNAGVQSYQQHSIKPIARESIRQAGGWAAASAGFEIGFGGGALLGIETGPGALAFGLAGGLIFGTAGFFGADWASKKIVQ